MDKHFALLGLKVRDRVTGLTGICTSIAFDLYGCVQALVNSGLDKEGRERERGWFDLNRLEAISKTPVMPLPDFSIVPGPESKPPKS